MKARRLTTFRVSLFCGVLGALLASTLFVSSAKKTTAPMITPPELDVRVAGSILRGGQIAAEADTMQDLGQGAGGSAPRQAPLTTSRAPEAAQLKALKALERAAGSKLSVEYNKLTGTPRHVFAASGYLTPPGADTPEKIALDFIRHWQGIFRFSERDVDSTETEKPRHAARSRHDNSAV